VVEVSAVVVAAVVAVVDSEALEVDSVAPEADLAAVWDSTAKMPRRS
jgi:hypothetical protein